MSNDAEITQRLARIEGEIKHLATSAQVATLSEAVRHIEARMPDVDRNTKAEAMHKGWQEAKEDSEKDLRATWALIVSIVALAASVISQLWERN